MVAIVGKSTRRGSGKNKPRPLPWVATGCVRSSMVSRVSAVGCHPLREVPSLRGRRSISLKRQVLRTRRPTGLDRATLTRERSLVKRNGALPSTTAGAMLGPSGTYPRPVLRRRSPVRIRRCPATAMPRSGMSQVDRPAPRFERQPSEEGRFGRRSPSSLLLRRSGGFYERTNDQLEARALAALL